MEFSLGIRVHYSFVQIVASAFYVHIRATLDNREFHDCILISNYIHHDSV